MDSASAQGGLMTSSSPASSGSPRPTLTLQIPRGLCHRCVRTLSRRLRDVAGVVSFSVDAEGGCVVVTGAVDPAAVRAVVDLSCS
jgi:hypothetical protein